MDNSDSLKEALRLHRAEDFAGAEKIYHEFLRAEPDHVVVLSSLGAALFAQEKAGEGIVPLKQATELQPDYAPAHITLAECYVAEGRVDEAVVSYSTGLKFAPDSLPGKIAFGDLLFREFRINESYDVFLSALALEPENGAIIAKVAMAEFFLGRLKEAENGFRQAIELAPKLAQPHWFLSHILLLNERFEEGWAEFDWRWALTKRQPPEAQIRKPIWDGTNLEGQKILLWGEQGIGDEMLFSTCIPDLLERKNPDGCVLVCDQRMAGLYRRSFPSLEVLEVDKSAGMTWDSSAVDFDVQISIGALPTYLRRSIDEFPSHAQHYVADAEKTLKWRRRLDALGTGPKIGVAWRGGFEARTRLSKSTDLMMWEKVLSVPGAQFINVQYGERSTDIARLKDETGVVVHDWDDFDPIADPDEQIAQISCLDLVIQVSNASVHMAGVLGVPVWNLIPFIPEWRWSINRDYSIWYPNMRLFRQPEQDGWVPLLKRVEVALRAYMEAR